MFQETQEMKIINACDEFVAEDFMELKSLQKLPL